MRRNFINHATGTAQLATKQGKQQPLRDVTEINKEKEICLKCTRPTCNGCGSKSFKKKLSKEKEKNA